MVAAGPVVGTDRESLRAALCRRFPAVAAALDDAQALHRARAWAAEAVPGAVVDAVRVGSVLLRSDGSCTMRYLLRLAPPGGERTLLVEIPRSSTGMVLRPFPYDPGLPTLSRAVDPEFMRGVLGRALPGTGGQRAIGRCAVDVVHHPRQGRCVLRYRLRPGAGGPGELRHPVVYGKVHGDDTASAAAAAMRLLRRGLAGLPGPHRTVVPRPLAVVPSLRLGLAEEVPGRPLLPDLVTASCRNGEGPAPDPQPLRQALRTAARTAAAVHACPAPGASLPLRSLAGELAAAERAIALLEPVWPDAARRLRPSVAHARELADATPVRLSPTRWPLMPVLAHGDLTPGQVLLDAAGGAGLVDVDTVCLAEPALDVGRFLAYLHVLGARRSPGGWAEREELTAVFLESYLDAYAGFSGGAGMTAAARRLFLLRTAAYSGLALGRMGVSACRQAKDDRLAAVVASVQAGPGWTRSGAG